MTGGGGAGGGKAGSGVTYQRQLPKFLQQHAHLLQREGGQDDSKKAWEDYGHSDELAKYGDEDDIAGNARKGLGSNPGSNQRPGAVSDVEERERKQEMAKVEKGKGNRAFSEKRYEDAIRSFTRCIELDPDDKVFIRTGRRRKRRPKTLKRRSKTVNPRCVSRKIGSRDIFGLALRVWDSSGTRMHVRATSVL